jgi:hypothetical protein
MKSIKIICVGVFLAINPALSFANKQGSAALKTCGECVIISYVDTIPSTPAKDQPAPEQKAPVIKKVPKSRRQAKPMALPGGSVKTIIKPTVIKPVIKVKV